MSCGRGYLENFPVSGSNLVGAPSVPLANQMLPTLSKTSACDVSAALASSANLYSVILPVRGSSLPSVRSGVASSANQTDPPLSTATSCAARPFQREGVPSVQSVPLCSMIQPGISGRDKSYSVTTTRAASPVGLGSNFRFSGTLEGPRTRPKYSASSGL